MAENPSLHDVLESLRTLRQMVESLEQGYRFEDAAAGRKLDLLRRAVDVLKAATPRIKQAFAASPHGS